MKYPGELRMKIELLFFGVLKEIVGQPAETIELPDGSRVRDVIFYYAHKAPRFEAMASSLAVSVNQEYSAPDRALRDGDEVGLLPPVSGGTNRRPASPDSAAEFMGAQFTGEVRITREPIDSNAIAARLKQPADGAAVIFDGVVRDNTRGRRTLYLVYESYESMAMKQMQALAAEARERFQVRGASIIHRLGRLEIGDTSVLIVVASAHRAAGFEACRWIIDTLKKTVPIWKKEYFEDGAVWADGEPFPEEIRHPGGTAGSLGAS